MSTETRRRAPDPRPTERRHLRGRRREDRSTADEVTVRITHRYADAINGVDLHNVHVGDQIQLPRHDADLLIAEGWAEEEKP